MRSRSTAEAKRKQRAGLLASKKPSYAQASTVAELRAAVQSCRATRRRQIHCGSMSTFSQVGGQSEPFGVVFVYDADCVTEPGTASPFDTTASL